MPKYYVTYSYLKNDEILPGSSSVEAENGICSHDDVKKIVERIKQMTGHTQLVINNWIRYETPTTISIE